MVKGERGMGVSGKVTGRAWPIPKGLAYGACISTVITVLISAISAHMVSKEWIEQERIGYCALAALLSASCIGAWAAAGKVKLTQIRIAMLNGAVYFGVLLSMTALFFGGQYEGMGVTLAVVALGSVAGGILSKKTIQSGSKKWRKKAYR